MHPIMQKENVLMPPPLPNLLHSPHSSPIYYQGHDLQMGAQPAVFYFALSAQMSLFEDPFNQPVLKLIQKGIRVFSWDLPFHEPGQNPREAMRHWAHEFIHRPAFISDFLDLCQNNINYLIEQQIIDTHRMAVAGLSRGGFIATHLAARDSRIKTLLGFAPLTQPQPLEELQSYDAQLFEKIALTSLVDRLIHTRLRFYIGNHDTRVSTDACYSFIQTLTKAVYHAGIHSPAVELMIYPSIGYKGHGTPPSIFYDGADWLTQQLLT
jgi:dienelactone hydrolase